MPPAKTVSGAEAAIMMNTSAGVESRRRSRCVFSICVSSSNGYPKCALHHRVVNWLFVHAVWFPVPDLVTAGQDCTEKQAFCTCITVWFEQIEQDRNVPVLALLCRSFHELRHRPVI